MTSTDPIGPRPAPGAIVPDSADPDVPLLPHPTLSGFGAHDALGLMLALMERMGELSTTHTEQRIVANQKQMRETLDEFLRKIAESIAAAKRAAEEEDDGGFFSDIADCVSDVVGTVVGTFIDFMKDYVEAPLELTEGAFENLTDPQGFLNVIKGQVIELATNGETADTVKGFTRGVVHFAADLTSFSAKFTAALAQGLDPQAAWDSVKADAKELWHSFQRNILENPDFLEVMAAVAKAAAVAGAVLSGGTLACVAIGVFLLCEADNRYGFVEDVVGKDAAPWVRLGMQVAATALLAGAAASSDGSAVLQWIRGGTAVLGGASQINAGLRSLTEGNERADELERQAEIQQILNGLQRLQRLLDSLVELLDEQMEGRRRNVEIATGLVETLANTEASAIMRG